MVLHTALMCNKFILLSSYTVKSSSSSILCTVHVNDQVVNLQGFVAYLKSAMMASNKKIFDVTQIDLDDFARLMSLLLQLFYTISTELTMHSVVRYF